MRKRSPRKLTLGRETLKQLDPATLVQAVGGVLMTPRVCSTQEHSNCLDGRCLQ
jgi:hypothetical protein